MNKASENKKNQLYQEFEDGPHTNCDASEAEALKQLFLDLGRARANVTEGGEDCKSVDAESEERLRNPSYLGPEHVVTEIVLRRMALNPIDGYSYLDKTINAKNALQSEKASKPRKGSKDKITLEIEQILLGDPTLSAKQVGRALEAHDKITFKNDEYSHADDQSTLKFINLPSRVSDAIKRINKKSG